MVLRLDFIQHLLGSGQGPEGECKNDVTNAFGVLSDTGPQILVGDEVQEPFLKIVRAQRRTFSRIDRGSQTADIAIPTGQSGRSPFRSDGMLPLPRPPRLWTLESKSTSISIGGGAGP